MKYCAHCGKELFDGAVICPGCGCSAEVNAAPKKVNYEEAVSGAATTNIISGILLALGIVCALFVNVWIGMIACLAAEIVAVIPNTKLRSAIKQHNHGADKQTIKTVTGDMKDVDSAFKFSFILSYIALACVIVFVLFA